MTPEELIAKWRDEAKNGRDGIGALGGVPISHAHAMATILRAERCADELEQVLTALRTSSASPSGKELRAYLDTLTITSDNIGGIRRSLFLPWDCAWNGLVRDETAARENLAAPLLQGRQK